ncbi:MAG: nucleoside kinase [Clostridia bacterium]|nr:nucleoside kinase [Clostridia bacterium]
MGKSLLQLAKEVQKDYKDTIILAKVDGKLSELNDWEIEDQKVEFITTASTIGNETYRRSVLFLMLYAIHKTAPDIPGKNVCVQYSLSKGLFCEIKDNNHIIDEKFIAGIKAVMEDAVKADLKIDKHVMPKYEAIEAFNKFGMADKTRLFKYRRGSSVNVYELDGYMDYFYGYMAPSTGMLSVFDIFLYENGFTLQMPVRTAPDRVPAFNPPRKLFTVLKESSEWSDILDVDTVGALNDALAAGRMNELMLVQEALQEQKIAEIARRIASDKTKKFVMIAGPSSSGKTTFSHRLSIQLMACGLKPHPIAVDNYFVEREETPLDADGNYNFEDLHAIDIELFNRQMLELLDGKRVELPTFNFKTGKKEYRGDFKQLGKDDILVIEGIHSLNDEMSKSLPMESKFKIYISALTSLNIDEHNRVATTDGRLIRRLVRDARTRGASAQHTLRMWESVRRGEEQNIFPYQEQADVMFNSALIYELSILKPFAEPILFAIGKDEPEYQEAKRLLKFLEYFLSYGTEDIPNNSILREFVGGGCFII